MKFKHGYVSEIDQFLKEIATLPGVNSTSRIFEEQKYAKISLLRDNQNPGKSNAKLNWKEF